MLPLTYPSPHLKRHLSQFGHFCRQSMYFTMGRLSPMKIIPLQGDLDPHINIKRSSLSQPKSSYQTVSRPIQHTGLTVVTDRLTYRLCCSICNKICRGAPNSGTDLSRWWTEVHHIMRTCGGDIAA